MTWVDILKEDTLEEKKKWFPFVFAFSGEGLTEKERRVGKGVLLRGRESRGRGRECQSLGAAVCARVRGPTYLPCLADEDRLYSGGNRAIQSISDATLYTKCTRSTSTL